MLTVHHLGKSQSERIVWPCEELGIAYELKTYSRDPSTRLAPPAYKVLHPLGAAPVITNGAVILAESGAVMEYIMARYGDGGLAIKSDDRAFADYLYWFHFTNGTLQPALGRSMILRSGGVPNDSRIAGAINERRDRAIGLVEERLGKVPWLAGDRFSAADIMIVFTLTTIRYLIPLDLSPRPSILAYLQRIA